MAHLTFDRAAVKRDSKGNEEIYLYFTAYRPSGSPLDNTDEHVCIVNGSEWFDMKKAVNKLLGQ